jgi:hypothetical protein
LAAGQVDAVGPGGAELGGQAGRQRAQDILGGGVAQGAAHLLLVVDASQVAAADRLPGEEFQLGVVLERAGQPRPPGREVEGGEVDPSTRIWPLVGR